MNQIAKLQSAPGEDILKQRIAHDELRSRLGEVNQALWEDLSFERAEHAIARVGDLLGMPWCWWTPDTAYPYDCEPARQFSHSRGWPPELMQIWRKHRISLYSPFHIRSRFEHLPFVSEPDLRERHHPCTGYARSNQILQELGIRAMLHVPVHLPKGRIGLVNWAGERTLSDVRKLLPHVAGELLALGNLFMRNFSVRLGQCEAILEERARLTVREWDCLRMLAQGYREAEAAEILGISKSTLRFHIDNVVQKFGGRNRTHAVAMAAQLGLLGPLGN